MQYLFLDESGNLHKNSTDRYFVIGGIFTNNYEDIKKSYLEINKDLKEKLNMDFNCELKAAYLNMEEKMDIIINLQKMNGFYIVAIVVDKFKLGKSIVDIHIYYNYVIRKLLDSLISKKIMKPTELILNIDRSSMKIQDINSLETYLKIHFNIEDKLFNFKIKVTYWDSRKNYMVQVADIICNTIWNIFNLKNKNRILLSLNKKNRIRVTELTKIK